MRILHVSDIHGNERWFRWLVATAPEFDLVCLTGDLLDLFQLGRVERQIALVERRLKEVTTPLAICSGNHDSSWEHPKLIQAEWMKALRRPGVWLDGDVFTLHGTTVRCIGWQALLPSSGTNEVWLHHAPPAGTDLAGAVGETLDVGDEILEGICREGAGRTLVLSGHQHHPRAWQHRFGVTWCFNPGCAAANIKPNHVVVDSVTRTATWRGEHVSRRHR